MKAFVFPGQGSEVPEPEARLLPTIRRIVGEHIPDQVKIYTRAARDADESRQLNLCPDVMAGHSLGEYSAAYAAGCFDFETGLWLVAQRDHLLAESAKDTPGGMVAILNANPAEVEKVLDDTERSALTNYISPCQTLISALRGALAAAAAKVRGRAIR